MPNLEAIYLGQPFRTNSYGIREEEYSLQKNPLTKRIIGLGDSVMFGWGVKEQDRYLNLVREKLSNIDKFDYETLNFGTPGYNTTMEVATYESLASKFEPDLVILHFVENDHGIPEFMTPPLDLYTLRKSFVLENLNNILKQFYSSKSTVSDFVGVEFPGFDQQSKKNVIKQYQHMLGSVGFKNALIKLGSLVCPKKIPVIILTGKLGPKFKKSIKSNANYWGFHIVEAAPVVNKYFEKLGIENDAKKRKDLLWLNEHDSHPSQLGHQLYAEALFPKVVEILNNKTGEFEPRCEH
jgi:lysophospholipase L1-like esterase